MRHGFTFLLFLENRSKSNLEKHVKQWHRVAGSHKPIRIAGGSLGRRGNFLGVSLVPLSPPFFLCITYCSPSFRRHLPFLTWFVRAIRECCRWLGSTPVTVIT